MNQDHNSQCLALGPVLFPLQIQNPHPPHPLTPATEKVQLSGGVRVDEVHCYLQLKATHTDMPVLPQVSSLHTSISVSWPFSNQLCNLTALHEGCV